MAAIRVDDFLRAFGEDPGVLPDGEVRGSTEADWQPVLDALHAAGWQVAFSSENSLMPRDASTLLAIGENRTFFACPLPGVQLNFFPGSAVAFDIDLREIVDQESLDAVCQAIRLLGLATGKSVNLVHEGSDVVVLAFDPSNGAFDLHP